MIDRVLCARGRDSFGEAYRAEDAIQGRTLSDRGLSKLAVIFPHWHNDGRLTDVLAKRLNQRSWDVLTYKFHDQILEPDIERVPESFLTIQDQVANDLEVVQAKEAYERTHLIGISLGTLAMSLVADRYRGFSSASFVLPSSRLSSSMWVGARTQGVRKGLEEKGYTKEEVEEAWNNLNPMQYTGAFVGKEVETVIAPSDIIIRYPFQKEMFQALLDSGVSANNRHSKLGHAATIAAYCFKGKI